MLVEKKQTFSKHIQIIHLKTSKRNCWTEQQKRRKSGIKTEKQKQRAHNFGAKQQQLTKKQAKPHEAQ